MPAESFSREGYPNCHNCWFSKVAATEAEALLAAAKVASGSLCPPPCWEACAREAYEAVSGISASSAPPVRNLFGPLPSGSSKAAFCGSLAAAGAGPWFPVAGGVAVAQRTTADAACCLALLGRLRPGS